MALVVKDAEVDRLAALQRASKAEVVRQALTRELERVGGVPSMVEQGFAFAEALRARAGVGEVQPADKDFIDGLYERSDVR